MIDRASRHIATHNFCPIEIDNSPIINQQIQGEALIRRWISDIETVAKVGGDVFVITTGTERNGCVWSICISKFRFAAAPCRVIEHPNTPLGALVAAVVEEFPCRRIRRSGDGRVDQSC